jgi:hypothetical protein
MIRYQSYLTFGVISCRDTDHAALAVTIPEGYPWNGGYLQGYLYLYC